VNLAEWVTFVRERRLAVVATTDPEGKPEAALVGIAATDDGELVFDTLGTSRKATNIGRDGRVALVVGLADEVTVQVEGVADILPGVNIESYRSSYLDQFPDGRERAKDPEIVYVRVRPTWLRRSDYRPGSSGVEELSPEELSGSALAGE
jgi:PPOX class probable F420-dependent enzyme